MEHPFSNISTDHALSVSSGVHKLKSTEKFRFGPKPSSILCQPDFLEDSDPENLYQSSNKRTVQVIYSTPKKKSFIDESTPLVNREFAIIAPLHRKDMWNQKPRHSSGPVTPSTIRRVINTDISSPLLIDWTSRKPLSVFQSCLNKGSLLNTPSRIGSSENSNRTISIGKSCLENKKVRFAPNSIVYLYESNTY